MGVIIDNKLNWESRIKRVCSKLALGSWAVLQLRNYVDKATLRMMHFSLIQSHLIYCISSWGSACQKALHSAEVLQKRVIRLMTFNRAHTHPLYKSLKIMKLKDLYIYETAKPMHHICNNSAQTATSKNFVTIREVHSYNTRKASRNHLYTRRARITLAQKSLQHAGRSIWNDLPSQIRNAPHNKFKKLLKDYLLQS